MDRASHEQGPAHPAGVPDHRGGQPHAPSPTHGGAHEGHSYRRLAVMTVLSFLTMYALMYAMVDEPASVYANVNQAYMAALMTSPMVVLELLLMRGMYRNARWNAGILVAGVLLGVISFAFIRWQTAVGDRQFLRSMIPHHSGAILMCAEARITDPELRTLCEEIIKSQQAEIAQMKALLAR